MTPTAPNPRSLPWYAWGREVRPGALALVWTTSLATAGQFTGATLLDPPASDIVGALGMAAVGCLIAGWWAKSLRTLAVGLLVCAWLWTMLAVLVLLQNPAAVSGWMGLGWALLASLLWLRDRREADA